VGTGTGGRAKGVLIGNGCLMTSDNNERVMMNAKTLVIFSVVKGPHFDDCLADRGGRGPTTRGDAWTYRVKDGQARGKNKDPTDVRYRVKEGKGEGAGVQREKPRSLGENRREI